MIGVAVGLDQNELITAQPRTIIFWSKYLLKLRCGTSKNVITSCMAEEIVDILEAVEVKQQNCNLGAVDGRLSQACIEIGVESQPVWAKSVRCF